MIKHYTQTKESYIIHDFSKHDHSLKFWSTEPDSNGRFDRFAGGCIGPLCHLCVIGSGGEIRTPTDYHKYLYAYLYTLPNSFQAKKNK
jgi:hypothetical protein